MFSIFSSDTATTMVNFIVISTFVLLVIYLVAFLVKRLRPETVEDKITKKLETSSTYQNVFTFTSVVLASTLFNLFSSQDYKMIWIVLIISVLTIVFHLVYNKVVHTNNAQKKQAEYKAHFELIEKVMLCKGYDLILNASAIEKIENRSESVYIFTENLTTDLPKSDVSDTGKDFDNVGLFLDIVVENIPKGKKYTYFLKDTVENIAYIKLYFAYHIDKMNNHDFAENICFYLVKECDFTFFTELYFYKDDVYHDLAFEWLPSLGDTKNPEKQFYLELSSTQVQTINEIIVELKSSYPKYTYKSENGRSYNGK